MSVFKPQWFDRWEIRFSRWLDRKLTWLRSTALDILRRLAVLEQGAMGDDDVEWRVQHLEHRVDQLEQACAGYTSILPITAG